MKKLFSLFLAAVMLLTACSALAEAAPALEDASLPQIGDVVNGFEAVDAREFPMIGATVTLFEHQKTGAMLMYVANEDNNRAFQLTFRTRPIDETGLPHVFEHSTLSGSEKYPSTALWMNLVYQTYNTYMNAYTTDAMTSYPIASLSEAQLLKYADFYTDSCLHPNVLTDESIYRTEAWRYHMASMDDDLTYEGTVYTEMMGATTLEERASLNAYKVTFPGSVIGYEYGGDPDYIPEMTWDDLKDYHEKFYHPSNCVAFLYGQFEDYAAFLALLDEAFSPYEKTDFHFEDSGYTAITEPVEVKLPYPMAEGTDTANQTVIYYYIVCPGLQQDPAQQEVIDNLCSLLSANSSVMVQKLQQALPTIAFSCGREVAAPEDAIVFVASNVNEDDAQTFKTIVDEALQEVAQNGFPKDMVDSIMASTNISTKLAPESGNPVEGILYRMAYSYVTSNNPFNYIEGIDALSRMDEWNDDGSYQAAISDWLLNKETWTLTTTYPAPGEKEIHDAALAEKLAEIKANMTDEEKQAIVNATIAAPADEDASALVAQLQAVTVESLPEEIREYEYSDVTGEDGIRRIDVTANVDGIGMPSIYLDAQTLPQEDIHWMRLFTRLIGKLDTDQHTKEELDVLTARYLYSPTFGVSVSGSAKDYHPYLVAEWTSMDEDLATGYALAEELLYHTQFTDGQKLLDKVKAEKASVRSTINGSPYNVAMFRGFAVDYPMWRYYTYLNQLDYYAFLEETEALVEANPEAAAEKLAGIQAFFANNAGAISAFAGNEDSIALNRGLADEFLGKLAHEEREAQEYDLPIPSKNEAIILDINIQFNNVFASFDVLGMDNLDASLDAVTTLVTDEFLVPILRDRNGVYTPWNGAVRNRGLYLITYRDPKIKETFDVYAALPQMIADLEVDQEVLNGYILNAYVAYAQGSGELTGANALVSNLIDGTPIDISLTYMRQLKAITPEDVKAAADLYQKAWDNGVHSTAGSVAAITENADLYDVILNPFNAVDSTQVEFTDVTEGDELYGAVRFVFENGIMAPLADDAFGVADTATVGDLFAGIYAAMGGAPNAAEEARDWLAGYELVEADMDVGTPLNEEFLCYIMVNGLGVGIGTDTPEAAVTRGDLADLLYQIFSEE